MVRVRRALCGRRSARFAPADHAAEAIDEARSALRTRARQAGCNGPPATEVDMNRGQLIAVAMLLSAASPASAQQVQIQAQQPYYGQPVYTQPYYGQPAFAPPAAQRQQVGTRERPNLGLIISGAVLLGVGWILDIVTGVPAGDDPFTSGSEPEWDAFRFSSLIPIAGPWIQLAVKPTGFTQDYWAPWLIIDGLIQATGLTLLVIGIATPETEPVYASRGVELAILPSVGPGHAGLSLVGAF
jgi:hypothetical protein